MLARGILIVVALISGATGLGYLVAADNPGKIQTTRLPMVESQRSSTSAPAKPTSRVTTRKATPPPDNPLQFMLANVAEQYQQTSRYPPYSVPLSEAQARAYRGNVYQPVVLPLADGGQFSVTLEKFRFTRGEDILIAANLSGPPVVARTMRASLESPQDRTSYDTTTLNYESDGLYQGIISSDVEPGEYRLIVEATVDSKPLRHVSTLTVEPDLGDFTGVDSAWISDNDLVIPVGFDARESGFFNLSAQLYNQGRPIAQLSHEQHLDSTRSNIELRAHGSVLADLDIQGELQLKGLQIRRLPARPGDRTDYAFGPDDGFTFSPPDLDSLRNTRSGDPESEQRAALLKAMAAGF